MILRILSRSFNEVSGNPRVKFSIQLGVELADPVFPGSIISFSVWMVYSPGRMLGRSEAYWFLESIDYYIYHYYSSRMGSNWNWPLAIDYERVDQKTRDRILALKGDLRHAILSVLNNKVKRT